jgi:hypothetical protein
MPINALIATGGGYRPPDFDINQTRQNVLMERGQGLRNQLLAQQVQAQPAQRQLDEQSLQLRELAMDIKAKAMSQAGSPKITLDYPNFSLEGPADKLAQVAEVVAQYPDQAQDPNFMPWLASQGISAKAREAKTEPGWTPKTREEKLGYESDLAKMKAQYKTGMKVYDSQGNLIVDTGGGEPAMEKKTKGAIEEKLLDGREQLARMKTIQAEYKPEYQEIGSRLSNAWTGIKAKMGKDIPKDDARKLTEWKKFQRKSIENINLYIKELTGAQMSEKEADRLRLAQPDPGENWWQGDDPITFKAKMDDIIKSARAAVARFEYYKAKGLSDQEIKGLVSSDQAISLEMLMANME